MKITAIQSDLSGGGALGFLKVKYSDSDDWQFIALSEDPDDGLWDWDDKYGDSDILSLENYQFVTGVYWFNKSVNDIGAIQQIGFDIYDAITGATAQRQLYTWYAPVDVFDESLSTTGAIKATSGNHITSFEGLNPVVGSGWRGYVPTDLGIVSEEIVPYAVTSSIAEDLIFEQGSGIVIPSFYLSIEDSAFQGSQLTSVEIPDSITSIGNNAFRSNQLDSVDIPDSVTSIGDYAFEANFLTSVDIPDSVTLIGEGAFIHNNLTSVDIPDSVTLINDYAFAGNFLTSVDIPDSVASIGEGAFRYNELTSVDIGDSVTLIGDGAFRNNELTSVYIPKSVTSIGAYAFDDNPLESVSISAYATFDLSVFGDGVEISVREGNINIINSVPGKGKLRGTGVPDQFTFDQFENFGRKQADKIIGFDPSQGDTIGISAEAFSLLDDAEDIRLISAETKKQLKALSKTDIEIVYYEKNGRLFFNGNGVEKGWGDENEGGLFAILKGKPELSEADFTILA